MKHLDEISRLFITADSTLLNAFRQMDELGSKLLMVGEGRVFSRFLSVGDVQRAILSGSSMDTVISSLPTRHNYTVSASATDDEIKQLLLKYRAPYMPVIGIDGQVERVCTWEEFFATPDLPSKSNISQVPVVVMAGGLGTRLRPLTNVIPKPLIPIGDKSILEHIISRFNYVGCDTFYLTVNHLSDVLKYYIDNRTEYGKFVSYIEEPSPLGTAGSLTLLQDKLKGTFFVTNCDILVDQDYSEIFEHHRASKNLMTVVTALRHHSVAYGTVESDESGQLSKLIEKPELTFAINAGLYVLEPEVLRLIPEGEMFHITHLIEKVMSTGGRVGVFPVSEGSWHDIGVWTEYLKIKDRSI